MPRLVGDLVDTEFLWIQIFKPSHQSAQILLVNPFRGLSVDLGDRGSIGEGHLLAQHAHIVLEALDRGAVLIHEVQLLNAAIATTAPDLPFGEEVEALHRTEIEVSDLPGIGILNGSAAFATDGAISVYDPRPASHDPCLRGDRKA